MLMKIDLAELLEKGAGFLDLNAASCAHIEDALAQEEEGFRRQEAAGRGSPTEAARGLALEIMSAALEALDATEEVFLRAVRVFDVWVGRAGDGASEADACLFAAVAMLVCAKLEIPGERRLGFNLPEVVLSVVNFSLERLGLASLTPLQVIREEAAVVAAETHAVVLATSYSWLNIMMNRWILATGGMFLSECHRAGSVAMALLRACARYAPASNDHRPFFQAAGVFGILLLVTRMVPADALRPDGLDDGEWEAMRWSARSCGHGAEGKVCAMPLPAEQAEEVVAFAAAMPIEEVRASARRVLEFLDVVPLQVRCRLDVSM